MELRDILFKFLGIFFIVTLTGVALGTIFSNYGITNTDTYDLQKYANKTSAQNFVGGLRDGLVNNPLLTILTLPINIALYFFNFINLANAFFSQILAAFALPGFIADWALMWITLSIVLGIYALMWRRI